MQSLFIKIFLWFWLSIVVVIGTFVVSAAVIRSLFHDSERWNQLYSYLTQVRGIGEWSVQMFLMFRLGRPDVLPIHDLGIRKGFQRVYGHKDVPKPQLILEYGERWRPYRSIASWYLWRAADEKAAKSERRTPAKARHKKRVRKTFAVR